MDRKNKVFSSLIIANTILALLAIYFYYFPNIINPKASNALFFVLFILLILSLVYSSLEARTNLEIALIIYSGTLISFLVRAIPNLRFLNPPLHDPYDHFIAALNIIQFGTLTSNLSSWYSGTDLQLQWPDMHLLSSSLVYLTNIGEMRIFKFQEPAIGAIFFIIGFVLVYNISGNANISLLSSFLLTLNDITIFYQSEYHPQGLAYVYFALLMAILIKYYKNKDKSYMMLALIISFAFITGHHFSSLIILSLGAMYFFAIAFIPKIPYLKIYFKDITIKSTKLLIIVQILIISIFVILFVFLMPKFLIDISYLITISKPSMTLLTFGKDVPLSFTIMASTKWVLLILAMLSIKSSYKAWNSGEQISVIVTFCILMLAFIGTFIIASPPERLIGFYLPFIALFASKTIYKSYCSNINSPKKILPMLIIVFILCCGVLNSQTPSYFLKDSPANTFYWYSNDLSSVNFQDITGDWINQYIPKGSRYLTEFDTRITPYFFGKNSIHSGASIGGARYLFLEGLFLEGYFVVNPSIKYAYSYPDGNTKKSFILSQEPIYNNGVIDILSYNLSR
jgi:hypothetical protein